MIGNTLLFLCKCVSPKVVAQTILRKDLQLINELLVSFGNRQHTCQQDGVSKTFWRHNPKGLGVTVNNTTELTAVEVSTAHTPMQAIFSQAIRLVLAEN